MNVSTQINNYQAINAYQKPQDNPVTLPVEPNKPTTEYSPSDVYKASQGNAISNKDGEISLTPQGQNNVNNAQEAKANEAAAQTQEKKDDARAFVAGYAGAQSKKSQVEIYLAVASEGKVSLESSDTKSILESLRDVQKENNAVQAYATYQANQKATGLF